ncbi:hypothetical protein SYNPS1DRAFT_29570 [Syncephalis pseudoplumigaleata]|uniref:Uncharacterized protein n=1 Tax=Syncephalis pseudoplumigaleata TaxID=1712513 RepID=A0A4P9YX24_9FUNG|nr:hypothetical protein SYNPS1DRAFT_29570 [Syncephalis pseudoplumigaleata]|eukprot:RKP24673.1 hypothetical protein SYNPS1DRAFT_29570 [Syncephalis pseudoplumigaleata]
MTVSSTWFAALCKHVSPSPNAPSLETLCKTSLIGAAMTSVLDDAYWKKHYLATYPVVPGQSEEAWLQWAMGMHPDAMTTTTSSESSHPEGEPLDQFWRRAFQWRELLEQRWNQGLLHTREIHIPTYNPHEAALSSSSSSSSYSTVESRASSVDGNATAFTLAKQSVRRRLKRLNAMVHGRCSHLVPLVSAAWGTVFELRGKHRLLIAPVANHYQSLGIPGVARWRATCTRDSIGAADRATSGRQGVCRLVDIYLPGQWAKFNYVHQVAASPTHLAIIPRSFIDVTTCICVWQTGRVEPCTVLPASQHAVIVDVSAGWLVWTDVDSQQKHGRFQLHACHLDDMGNADACRVSGSLPFDSCALPMRGQSLVIDASDTSIKVFQLCRERPHTLDRFSWQVVCFERIIDSSNATTTTSTIRHRIERQGQFIPQPVAVDGGTIARRFLSCRLHKSRHRSTAKRRNKPASPLTEIALTCANRHQVVIHMWHRGSHDKAWLALLDTHIDVAASPMDGQAAPEASESALSLRWQHRARYHAIKVVPEHCVIIAHTTDHRTLVLSLHDGSTVRSYRTLWPDTAGNDPAYPIIGRLQCVLEIDDEAYGYQHKIVDAVTGKSLHSFEVKDGKANTRTLNGDDDDEDGSRQQASVQLQEPFHTFRSLSAIRPSPSTSYRRPVEVYCAPTHMCMAVPHSQTIQWRLWAKAANALQPAHDNAAPDAQRMRPHKHRGASTATRRRWAPQPRSVSEGRVGTRELLAKALWRLQPQARPFHYVMLDATS